MPTISEALAIALEHYQAGRLQIAEQIYGRILAVEPNHADAWHLLGLLANQMGKHGAAVEYIQRAIRLNGAEAAFHNDLGTALKDLGSLGEAVACYRRALKLKPNYVEAHNNLGNALMDQGNLNEAVACYHQALELKPGFAEAQFNMGTVLQEQGKLDEAVACYQRVLAVKPDFAEAYNNLGNALMDQANLDDAVAYYRRALELKPDYVEAHNNLGLALRDQGKLDEAVACYHRALELKPDFAEAHWNRSLLWLLIGDFARGWPEFDWRWQAGLPPRPFRQPIWDGGPLEGRTLLVHAEQGFGDTIQFVRLVTLISQLRAKVVVACQKPLLRATEGHGLNTETGGKVVVECQKPLLRATEGHGLNTETGGKVVVECQKPLLRLLQTCPGVEHLVGQGDDLPAFDTHIPMMSLGRVLQASLEVSPTPVPYLFAAPDLVRQWRAELGSLAGFKIGIFWSSRLVFANSRLRFFALRFFEPLAELEGVRLVSLQKGLGVEQLAGWPERLPIMDAGSRVDDFMDTAAVMMNLDLVITCDTAVAHLAGALGVPVWVVLPLAGDWRWLLDRQDCPWYPTMRLFRQKTLGDWSPVFDQIKAELCERLQPGKS